MTLISAIKKETDKQYETLVNMRRHLHMNPELSFQEKETSEYVTNILDEHGIKYTAGYCKYGIVAEVKGRNRGNLIYLRGDMDALPIQEKNKVNYKSKREGIMHACGHDVHTTSLIGAAVILHKLREKLSGTIRFVFQPGEEKHPGGASIMIKEGAIKNAKKAKILGQHVHPPLEVGKVGFHPGEYMASADEIYIDIIGKGGHAALPTNFIDPIMISSEVISALHKVVSRYSDPKIPTVLSFGKIWSDGGATNVIPEKVHLQGTFRCMDEKNRVHLHKVIKDVVKHTCKAYGGKSKVNIRYGYPTLVNDVALTRQAMAHAKEYMGDKNVVELPKRMTAEDFSYYSQMMPACFYRLGTGNQRKGITSPVHTPTFDIDESALATGAGLMAFLGVMNAK